MAEVKDPKIKLFGRTIGLPETFSSSAAAAECGGASGESGADKDPPCSADSVSENEDLSTDAEDRGLHKDRSCLKQDNAKEQDKMPRRVTKSDAGAEQTLKTEEDQSETEKTLKKPDKILPCPRCNSMDTKFCYFNNYNVNQPRHFCKNCQRYWTAGGTMRNVPIGAGRRRHKNAVQFRQQPAPEAQQNTPPLCESMASVLSIAEKTSRHDATNGLHNPGEVVGNGHDHAGESLVSKDELGNNGMPGLIPPIPYFPGASWPYPFGPAGFPLTPFYAAGPQYWGCSWNVPWPVSQTSSMSQSAGPNSLTLGKHLRDDNAINSGNQEGEMQKQSDPEKCLWVPKTLRIDNPGEAAKSSIWATLGVVKNDRVNSIGGSGLFKAFQREKVLAEVPEASAVLQANPAALSRSLSFHESS